MRIMDTLVEKVTWRPRRQSVWGCGHHHEELANDVRPAGLVPVKNSGRLPERDRGSWGIRPGTPTMVWLQCMLILLSIVFAKPWVLREVAETCRGTYWPMAEKCIPRDPRSSPLCRKTCHTSCFILWKRHLWLPSMTENWLQKTPVQFPLVHGGPSPGSACLLSSSEPLAGGWPQVEWNGWCRCSNGWWWDSRETLRPCCHSIIDHRCVIGEDEVADDDQEKGLDR